MSKCNRVKNPCKICLGSVSQKTGLQCQGACGTWVHYACLNYTPGKIKDIKAGIIKVTCPCPDCKTTMPKEYRTDQPYSCTNTQCPANRPPKCENTHCPINEGGISLPATPCAIPCPLGTCGNDCKQHSVPQLPNLPRVPLGQPCVPVPSSTYKVSPAASDPCFSATICPSGCSSASTPDIPGDYGSNYGLQRGSSAYAPDNQDIASCNIVVEQLCNTVGQLTCQINDLMAKMKQAVTEKDPGSLKDCPANVVKKCPAAPAKDCPALPPTGGAGRGGAGGPRKPGIKQHLCPKPCFCPGNPVKRENY